MKNTYYLGAVVVLTAGMTTPALAERFALGVKAGTSGIGPEITVHVSEQVRARLGHGIFSQDRTETTREFSAALDFDLDLDIGMTQLTLDFHPGGGQFRGTAGIIFNGNELEGSAIPGEGVFDIGDNQYSAADIGELNARLSFDSIAPYLGIGWSNSLTADGRLGYSIDVGVAYVGSASVDLTATNETPQLSADLDRERAELEDDLNPTEYWPVVSAGITWRF